MTYIEPPRDRWPKELPELPVFFWPAVLLAVVLVLWWVMR